MSGQTWTVMGAQGRDCPICYRQNSLFGRREGSAPILTCSGCGERFTLEWGNAPGGLDQLRRKDPAPAATPYKTIGSRP